ncbi:MAG: DUF6266 family protein, partial [Daejeonella sp.]
GSYIRGIPRLNKNRKPTPDQLAARAKFAFLNMWLKKFKTIIAMTFRNYSPKMTGMMASYSCNAKNVLGEYPDFQIDFPAFMISYGDLQGAENPTAISEETGIITYHWDSKYDHRKGSTVDSSLLFAIIPESGNMYADLDSSRGQNTGKLPIAKEDYGKVAEVYLAFLSFDRLKSSKSQYLGQVVVSEVGGRRLEDF